MKQKLTLTVCLFSLLSFGVLHTEKASASMHQGARIEAANDDKADLQAYYDEISANFQIMTAPRMMTWRSRQSKRPHFRQNSAK